MASGQPDNPPKWLAISAQKKREQRARIPSDWELNRDQFLSPDSPNYLHLPRACGLLNEEELRLTEAYDATALAEALRNREVKSVDVVRAFCKVRLALNDAVLDLVIDSVFRERP